MSYLFYLILNKILNSKLRYIIVIILIKRSFCIYKIIKKCIHNAEANEIYHRWAFQF